MPKKDPQKSQKGNFFPFLGLLVGTMLMQKCPKNLPFEGRLLDAILVALWLPFGSLWLPLAPFWLSFGSLFLHFGRVGSLLASLWLRFTTFRPSAYKVCFKIVFFRHPSPRGNRRLSLAPSNEGALAAVPHPSRARSGTLPQATSIRSGPVGAQACLGEPCFCCQHLIYQHFTSAVHLSKLFVFLLLGYLICLSLIVLSRLPNH
jgi:hypothetical protein